MDSISAWDWRRKVFARRRRNRNGQAGRTGPSEEKGRTSPWRKGLVRQGGRVFGDALAASVPGCIGAKAMDDRHDEREPELRHGGCVRKVLLAAVHKMVLLAWFSTIMMETGEEGNTHGVRFQESDSWAEHLLATSHNGE